MMTDSLIMDGERILWINKTCGDRICLTHDILTTHSEIEYVRCTSAGAVSIFIGTTRDTFEGQKVTHLEYEAFSHMAVNQIQEIITSIRSKWSVEKVNIVHKLGECPIGDISVIIAISSVHRGDSLDAVDFAINELKKTVPIWKKEMYENGDSTWKKNIESCV